MNEKDLRVIKTRKNIENSFILLLEEKDFTKITVQDILDKALINRSTFYKHYTDKYQLAESMCHQLFSILQSGVTERFQCDSYEELIHTLKLLYHNMLTKRQEVLALFGIQTETIHLYDDMQLYLKNTFKKQYMKNNPKEDMLADYFSSLYASLVMTTLKWCMVNKEGYDSLEEHTDFFLKLKELFI